VPRTLLIGSKNLKKAKELAEILARLPWEVKSLADFPDIPEAAETAETFEQNALDKAAAYARQTGLWCVADDSGLIVDALDGAPGVYSARYAGGHGDDAANRARLLRELAGVPEPKRTARFVCCAALVTPEGDTHVEIGTVEGRIIHEERGAMGFGYDPLFVPEGKERTFAEMPADEKHTISHRGRAFGKLRAYLEALA